MRELLAPHVDLAQYYAFFEE
eukprot:SAG31_NODE_14697_length_792_cov_1.089466_1_plen_20_part_10